MMTGDFEQRRVVLATGVELDTVDMGPKDAPALIFLHGFPESHRTWRHQLPHFSDRFRCIAPDQRGYRGSSKPRDAADYTPDKLIADIFALADALGVRSEEHTSELQSLIRISYAVFCLKKKKYPKKHNNYKIQPEISLQQTQQQ